MPSQPAAVPQPRNPVALIVDDASGMRAYLRAVLTAAGFDCVEAGDGAEGFGVILSGGVDLVLTDLDMPVMDGFQLISALSLLPPSFGRPPIVVISGLLTETAAPLRPELRLAAALLAKPVQPADLLKAIGRAMGISVTAN